MRLAHRQVSKQTNRCHLVFVQMTTNKGDGVMPELNGNNRVEHRVLLTRRVLAGLFSGVVGAVFVSVPTTLMMIHRLWRTGFPDRDVAYDIQTFIPFVGGPSLVLFCVLSVAGFAAGQVGTRRWINAVAISTMGAIISSLMFGTLLPVGLSNSIWRAVVAFAGAVIGNSVLYFSSAGRKRH